MDKIKIIKDWLKPYLEDKVRDEHEEGFFHCAMLLNDFLDTLSEEPNKSLEEEIDKEWKKSNPIDEGMGVESAYIHIEAFDIIARHFYELGQKDAANKYDEIEYNRQQAEKENK